ncbi:MAG: hypothetical protein QOF66_4314 [Mycobacterium sp.]|nr:hypothetical protein [Mycobacterium sp.]
MAARRGRVDNLESRGAGVGPPKPLLRSAAQVLRWCAVITVVTVCEHAAVHPRRIASVHRCQRLPELILKQHAAIAIVAARHAGAPRHMVCGRILNPRITLRKRPRAMCVILSHRRGGGAAPSGVERTKEFRFGSPPLPSPRVGGIVRYRLSDRVRPRAVLPIDWAEFVAQSLAAANVGGTEQILAGQAVATILPTSHY